ncbi:hypothetical protein [uncultured Duncaniella sp.]|uniref:hypothetical protein n=1 Tax=uncultured Duncaniella sp. TaxID=2768039 RepID=UPI0026E56AE2|nr:hypothetical protein [uncultured Duncaniella sp.]
MRMLPGSMVYMSWYVRSPGLMTRSVAELPHMTSSLLRTSQSISNGSSASSSSLPTGWKGASDICHISTLHSVSLRSGIVLSYRLCISIVLSFICVTTTGLSC